MTYENETMKMHQPRHGWLKAVLPPAFTVVAVVAIWQAAVGFGWANGETLASPADIALSLGQTWRDLASATAVTALETVTGFLISIVVGVALGIGLYASKAMHRSIYPLLVAAQTIPIITIAPLFMIWFGFNMTGKIVLVTVFSVFSIAVETSRGLSAVPDFYEAVALTCGAGRVWTLFHVKLRVAARQVFSGIRISAAYVVGTAVTAEYLGATNGLGVWLQNAFNSFQTPMIFSATLVIVAMTGMLLGLVALAERLLLGPGGEDDARNLDESEN